jgi:hypothetical protein
MARYPIKIRINLEALVELNYSIRADKKSLSYELRTQANRPPFSKSVMRSPTYEMDLLTDALNSILNNAKPDLKASNVSHLVNTLMDEITLKNSNSFALVLRDGTLEIVK